MEENRNAATLVSALSAREEESLPVEEGEMPNTEGLTGLVDEVSRTVGSRREALKQEVIRLQKEAAHEQ
jgi:hypothetical protein